MIGAETIREAILYLAGRCDGARAKDGVGFNGYDAPWGSEAADRVQGGMTVNPERALRVLGKYRKQLERGGIILPTLADLEAERPPEPVRVTSPASATPGVTVSRSGDLALLRFPYDPALVAKARELPGRRWAPELPGKPWTVPIAQLHAILAAFPNACLDSDLAAEAEAKVKAEAATARAIAARQAADLASLDALIPGLARPLFGHQDTGTRWLVEHRTGILADDMGLGKTMQALVAAKALGHRVFVVAPAGLRVNWLREAEAVQVPIEVFSWAKVPDPIEEPYTLIADEAHYAQNAKASRTKKFLALAAKADAVFALTGTPIKNGRPVNLFPLLVATRHPLAADKSGFERRYCAAGPTKWSKWDTTGAAHLDELHRRISDGVLRRMKAECLDLPAKVRVLRKAELSDDARATYETVLREKQVEYQRRKTAGEIGEADALVLMNHLRHAGSLAKVESAVELAEEVLEQGGQVVIFTAFTDSAALIADHLGSVRITGAEDADARTAAIDAFQAGRVKSIVCTLGAGNVGITLTAAQTVVLVDRPWTPGDAIQAEDRLHRIGQKGSVLAVWLQANGADEAIDALLQAKHERIELVLAGKRKTLRGLGSIAEVAEAVLGA